MVSIKWLALGLAVGLIVSISAGCSGGMWIGNAPQSALAAELNEEGDDAPHGGDTLAITFGVYTADKPTEVVAQFRPVLNAVEERMVESLGQPVSIGIEVASTYEQGIANIVAGNVDFARFGPASYTEAKAKNPALKVLAIEEQDGEKVFYGIIVVHEDSDIESISDLKEKRFAFGDELSTIGRFLSQLFLYENGIRASDLSEHAYLERHDAVGAAVGAGEYDAGALKESTFDKLVDKGVPIRELARFPNVTKPWFAHQSLPDDVFVAFQEALLALDDPDALAALGQDGFTEGDDGDYAVIRESIQNNHLFFVEQVGD